MEMEVWGPEVGLVGAGGKREGGVSLLGVRKEKNLRVRTGKRQMKNWMGEDKADVHAAWGGERQEDSKNERTVFAGG